MGVGLHVSKAHGFNRGFIVNAPPHLSNLQSEDWIESIYLHVISLLSPLYLAFFPPLQPSVLFYMK